MNTTFGREFARQIALRRRINLTVSTIVSTTQSSDDTRWLESILEIWHQGAMVFDSSGKVVQATEFTEKILAKYFANAKLSKNGIPLELANWMKLDKFTKKSAGIVITEDSFVIENGGEELQIQLIVDNRARRRTLMLRETVHIQPKDLLVLGVTNREAEVLFLIAKGKTNPEIGILLDISTRTVQKHVEHIYVKIGVETRTAAMLRVNELDSSLDSQDLEFV